MAFRPWWVLVKTPWGRPAGDCQSTTTTRPAQRARLAHSRALMVGRHDTGAQSKARLRFREGRAWCAVVLSHASRPIRHASLLVQPAKHALVGYPIKRVPEAPIRGVEDDGPARAQMTPPVRVGTDEHVHQAAVDPANLRRQTPRIGVSGSPWVRRPSWSAGQPVSELLSAGWWWWLLRQSTCHHPPPSPRSRSRSHYRSVLHLTPRPVRPWPRWRWRRLAPTAAWRSSAGWVPPWSLQSLLVGSPTPRRGTPGKWARNIGTPTDLRRRWGRRWERRSRAWHGVTGRLPAERTRPRSATRRQFLWTRPRRPATHRHRTAPARKLTAVPGAVGQVKTPTYVPSS